MKVILIFANGKIFIFCPKFWLLKYNHSLTLLNVPKWVQNHIIIRPTIIFCVFKKYINSFNSWKIYFFPDLFFQDLFIFYSYYLFIYFKF